MELPSADEIHRLTVAEFDTSELPILSLDAKKAILGGNAMRLFSIQPGSGAPHRASAMGIP